MVLIINFYSSLKLNNILNYKYKKKNDIGICRILLQFRFQDSFSLYYRLFLYHKKKPTIKYIISLITDAKIKTNS